MLEFGILNLPTGSWSLRRDDMTTEMLGAFGKYLVEIEKFAKQIEAVVNRSACGFRSTTWVAAETGVVMLIMWCSGTGSETMRRIAAPRSEFA